jgi:hypothetical protein
MTDITNELRWIEYYSDDLKSRSDSIAGYVAMIAHRLPYETRAEASLAKAEASLLRSLQIVRKARQDFEKKDAA